MGSLLVRYDGDRNVRDEEHPRGTEEARPEEQVGAEEGIWSLATDEEASVVGHRDDGGLGDTSQPNRQNRQPVPQTRT